MRLVHQRLDRAALTLHEGFLTSGLGDRGAVLVALLVMAVFPDSLAFCFWLGLGLLIDIEGLSPATLGLTPGQLHALSALLVLTGIWGLWHNLAMMARRTPVRSVSRLPSA